MNILFDSIIRRIKIRRMGAIPYCRSCGVEIGDKCRFVSLPDFGSEPWLISLGNHVEICSNVVFITHDGSTWVFRDQEKYKNVIRYGKIQIKDNCFIGKGTTILPGVTIETNCIIGACSLVTSNCEAGGVYAGVPARFICKTEEFAEKCLKETPEYDKEAYFRNKKDEVLRMLNK